MPSLWKGAVTFGLVNVPVRMHAATADHDIELHQVHATDGGRIRYQRTCEVCGERVSYEDIVRSFDAGDRQVTLSAEDLATLPVSRSHDIEVVEFVPREQLDPIRFEKSYFLEPTGSAKAYTLLCRVLEQTDRVAIVHMTLRTRSRLAALRTYEGVLALHTLLWNDEVRKPHFESLDESVVVSDQELAMSAMLVESLSEDFSPGKFADDYQVQLRELIDTKLATGEALPTPAAAASGGEGGDVLDLMEALRRSVEQARGSQTPAEEPAPESRRRPRRRTG